VDAAHDVPMPIADDVWIVDSGPIGRVIRMPIRMTVLRLVSGALWLHSPMPFTPSLLQALRIWVLSGMSWPKSQGVTGFELYPDGMVGRLRKPRARYGS
jgi:hypothetical protein